MDIDEPTDFFGSAPEAMALDDPNVDEDAGMNDGNGEGDGDGMDYEGGKGGEDDTQEDEDKPDGVVKERAELFAPSIKEIESARITQMAKSIGRLFLWPLYTDTKTPAEILLSIVFILNENSIMDDKFHLFFRHFLAHTVEVSKSLQDEESFTVMRGLTSFLVYAFQCMEKPEVRKELLGLLGIPILGDLDDAAAKEHLLFEKTFLSTLAQTYLRVLGSITNLQTQVPQILYCERFLELVIDLESQMTARRYVHILIDDHMVVPLSHRSTLMKLLTEETTKKARGVRNFAFAKLLDRLEFYLNFQVDNLSGEALTDSEYLQAHYTRMQKLQRLCFSKFRDDLEDLALAAPSSIDTIEHLRDTFAKELGLRTQASHDPTMTFDTPYLAEILAHRFSRRTSYLDQVSNLPVIPTMLTFPKLNLQYLTVLDYLQRNFSLYRLEARLAPRYNYEAAKGDSETQFFGWARMGVPIEKFELVDVGDANVFDGKPRHVRAKITYSWDTIKRHDVLFLVNIQIEPQNTRHVTSTSGDFRTKFGVRLVRGCEVIDLSGEDGQTINERSEAQHKGLRGVQRTLRVSLDVDQFLKDGGKDGIPYGSFNVLVRRKARENNFKAVLETMRDLMQSDLVVPEWLTDTFLGYGDPKNILFRVLDLVDTFLDEEHVKRLLRDWITLDDETASSFVLSEKESEMDVGDSNEVAITSYSPPYAGPLKDMARRYNEIRFTQSQVRAITSACIPGLTLVSGPPGTGKTDVAVQIISNLYHAHPDQNILLITHSNHALNQLFEKIMALDIDPRHLLRLGHGFEDLDSDSNWGKYGRVQSFLEQRTYLLGEVDKLAYSLGIQGAFGNSCETASYFYAFHIKSLWEPYLTDYLTKDGRTPTEIATHFPFHLFFHEAPQPLFPTDSTLAVIKKIAYGCYGHIKSLFQQLEEIRAFELLRNNHDRSNYLLVKEARIIALTCTHAALKRRELISLGFRYDTVIMEEAAQILEVEAFIPLVLQSADPETGESRLKRVVLIGDQCQLPPIVRNVAISRYGNLEQSLFTRLMRLGVDPVSLDRQGRCRTSLCDLFRWRYEGLKDLGNGDGDFAIGNPGFSFEYQMVNVENFNGKGETEPVPYFYQNLGEAEYVVAVFQYMRLLGYPAHKISILTTYNGQKALIEDVLDRRCKRNPLFGLPARVSTVDKYQGQQNDYILLSLVRTKTVGHIRDVRRLIVALSRARLGLYVFCRQKLFENCYELKPALRLLGGRPSEKLWLRGGEEWGEAFSRGVEDTGVVAKAGGWKAKEGEKVFEIENVVHMGKYVFNMIQEQMEWMRKKKQAYAPAVNPATQATDNDDE
ncbi:P-loop containing nucleoside triphosphate hydrolase protein [Chytridium lagenaria]|nr:P-loop containing nucleoside triphosphate hydrolase protein [Chytridium lagenaria]